MIRAQYHLVDVFTDTIFGGNPLAVFPDADLIPERFLPLIARELNLSETAFVLRPKASTNSFRLRFFTPGIELPFAGHPTVGTACVLARLGRLGEDGNHGAAVFEEGVGPIGVNVEQMRDRIFARFRVAKLPETGPPPPPAAEIARMLRIDASDVRLHPAPIALSCGTPFLFVCLENPSVLSTVRFDEAEWKDVLRDHWAPHVYVVAHDGGDDARSVRARMFAPAMRIAEDPATGAAASALAGFLDDPAHRDGVRTTTVVQGVEIGRRSTIRVDVEKRNGELVSIHVGGETVFVGKGEMTLPVGGP